MRFCILLVAIIATACIYMACNKHTSQRPVAGQNKILSGWVDSANAGLATHLTLNEAQHVTKEESDNDIASYQFSGDIVIIREFNKEENRYVYEFVGKMDSNKRLLSGIATSSYISSTPDTVYHDFVYNGEGCLVKETRISDVTDTFLIKYEYEDKMLKKVLTYSNGTLFNTKEFTYYDNDLSCDLPDEFKFRKNINNLVGLSDQKPVKKIVSAGRNGKQRYILNYEYKMDRNGYAFQVIGRKGKKVSGVTTYYYNSTLNSSNVSVAVNRN
ncbi:MAG: hypothetical protein H7122_05910 [Chitinophagaceae bacterium]|nr:hypothetical protein [Chitinophagaceae bacterium]